MQETSGQPNCVHTYLPSEDMLSAWVQAYGAVLAGPVVVKVYAQGQHTKASRPRHEREPVRNPVISRIWDKLDSVQVTGGVEGPLRVGFQERQRDQFPTWRYEPRSAMARWSEQEGTQGESARVMVKRDGSNRWRSYATPRARVSTNVKGWHKPRADYLEPHLLAQAGIAKIGRNGNGLVHYGKTPEGTNISHALPNLADDLPAWEHSTHRLDRTGARPANYLEWLECYPYR